jgi:hypothetical protein
MLMAGCADICKSKAVTEQGKLLGSIEAKETVDYCQVMQQKKWLEEGCSELSSEEQTNLQWL